MQETPSYRTVVIGGLTTRYLSVGTGPALILVHGWAQSAVTWRGVISNLAQEYTVYALDMPGFGMSEAPPSAWSIEEYAQFVHSFCEALSLSPYAVLGHSFGARVALSYAATFGAPKLLLVSMGDWNRVGWFRKLNTAIIHTVGRLMPGFLFYMHKTFLTPREFADNARVEREHGKRMLAVYMRTHQKGDDTIFSRVKAKTLLIYGKSDPITAVSIGSRIQLRIAGSTLVVIPDAGHLVHIEQPSAFLAPILAFLRG